MKNPAKPSTTADVGRLERVRIDDISPGPNPRPISELKGSAMEELVASVRAKGVLVPIIVRPIAGTPNFQLVAGQRRLAAAILAGEKDIPASIRELTDDEAAEVSIVENLQREGIHPLDEAQAFRALAANAKEMADVAARVGKPVAYVRQRLVLTNLDEKIQASYRKAELNDGAAALIANLAPSDQKDAYKALQGGRFGDRLSVRELKEWIVEHVGEPMKRQPWVGKPELEKAVGACKECKPNVATLFGEVKVGECTSFACWSRKMKAYIAHQVKGGKVAISSSYSPDDKSLPPVGRYHQISSKKDTCPSAKTAVYGDGATVGATAHVCVDGECKMHAARITAGGFKRTAEEVATRKRQLADDRAKAEKQSAALAAALEKIEWPMNAHQLDALVAFAFERYGGSYLIQTCKLLGIKAKDHAYEKALREWAGGDDATPTQKVRLLVAVMAPSWSLETSLKKLNA